MRMGTRGTVKGKEAGRCRPVTQARARTHPGWGRCVALSVSGRARLSGCVFVWVCDLCVCVGDRLRMGARTGRGGGCGSCPCGPPRLGSGGCRRRRGLGGCQGGPVVSRVCSAAAGCRLQSQVLILPSPCCPCLLPGEPPCGSPRPSLCVCVLGEIPGDAGVTVTPAKAAAAALPLAPHPGGDSGAMARPQGRGSGSPAAATPNLPGEGLPLAAQLFVVWGSAPPPLSLLAPGVSDWGWG